MGNPFIGSEAIKSGALPPYRLRSRCVAIHPDVYVAVGTDLTATTRARAAWLWSRRRGVIAGHSASAVHGAKWVDDRRAAELLYEHRRPPAGIRTWSDQVADDEIQLVTGVPATTPARTAFDLACRNPIGKAVAAIDALARATKLDVANAEVIGRPPQGAPQHPSSPPRAEVSRRRCRITPRDLAAVAPDRSGLPAAAHTDPGLRRARRVSSPRYGLGGHQGSGGVRG